MSGKNKKKNKGTNMDENIEATGVGMDDSDNNSDVVVDESGSDNIGVDGNGDDTDNSADPVLDDDISIDDAIDTDKTPVSGGNQLPSPIQYSNVYEILSLDNLSMLDRLKLICEENVEGSNLVSLLLTYDVNVSSNIGNHARIAGEVYNVANAIKNVLNFEDESKFRLYLTLLNHSINVLKSKSFSEAVIFSTNDYWKGNAEDKEQFYNVYMFISTLCGDGNTENAKKKLNVNTAFSSYNGTVINRIKEYYEL